MTKPVDVQERSPPSTGVIEFIEAIARMAEQRDYERAKSASD